VTGSAWRRRGFATGLCQPASSLGNFIALPLLAFLILRLSWRWMFLIAGAAGVVLGGENTTSRPPSFAEWKQLFAHGTTRGMIAGFAVLPGTRTPHRRRVQLHDEFQQCLFL